jgi:hypothetical protein
MLLDSLRKQDAEADQHPPKTTPPEDPSDEGRPFEEEE